MKVLGGSKKMWKRYVMNYGKVKPRHESCAANERQHGMLLFGTVDNESREARVSRVESLGGGSGKNGQGSGSVANGLFVTMKAGEVKRSDI